MLLTLWDESGLKKWSFGINQGEFAGTQASTDPVTQTLATSQGNATLKPGDVFLLCQTTDDATNIMRAMGHRKYDGRCDGSRGLVGWRLQDVQLRFGNVHKMVYPHHPPSYWFHY